MKQVTGFVQPHRLSRVVKELQALIRDALSAGSKS